jgi:hypothetical protein
MRSSQGPLFSATKESSPFAYNFFNYIAFPSCIAPANLPPDCGDSSNGTAAKKVFTQGRAFFVPSWQRCDIANLSVDIMSP